MYMYYNTYINHKANRTRLCTKIDESKWNSKKDTSSLPRNKERREQTENKIADIEANISIITLHTKI